MYSIVTGILGSTVGLLLNKARDNTTDKLKDGDVTDAKIRDIIVRELNDVKTKMDGLSRRDLLTSYSYLQEGVNLLKACLDKSEAKPKVGLSETHCDGGETSVKPSGVKSGILTEALTLSQAIRKVKINWHEEFSTAKKRFEDARKEATRAFCNEALNTKDRIFAGKLRIVAELLECLEDPETAMTNILPFLETVHSQPAIGKIFSVYINGGVRSVVGKVERVENVKSVMLINYVLFQFVTEFGSKYCSAMNWPTIELGDRSFSPILDWREASTRRSWGKEFIQPPNEVTLDSVMGYCFPNLKHRGRLNAGCVIEKIIVAVNSHGEVAIATHRDIYVASRAGRVKNLKLNYPGDDESIRRIIVGLAVDSNDNIYVLMYLKMHTESNKAWAYFLYVFEENYKVKQNRTLRFLDASDDPYAKIAVNKNNNIIIHVEYDPHVYVCNNAGELKQKFKLDTSYLCTLTTSNNNEILLVSAFGKEIHRYTEKGNLEMTITVPKGHEINYVAFHHDICKIVVLTHTWSRIGSIAGPFYYLLCYSETAELENSTSIGHKTSKPVIISHPSGPAVVLCGSSVTFI